MKALRIGHKMSSRPGNARIAFTQVTNAGQRMGDADCVARAVPHSNAFGIQSGTEVKADAFAAFRLHAWLACIFEFDPDQVVALGAALR
ncbi:MAG: hypothetical protein ACREPT_13680 [Rudaea sp.]